MLNNRDIYFFWFGNKRVLMFTLFSFFLDVLLFFQLLTPLKLCVFFPFLLHSGLYLTRIVKIRGIDFVRLPVNERQKNNWQCSLSIFHLYFPWLRDPQYLNKHKWGAANRKSTAHIFKFDDIWNYSLEWMDALEKAIIWSPLRAHHFGNKQISTFGDATAIGGGDGWLSVFIIVWMCGVAWIHNTLM